MVKHSLTQNREEPHSIQFLFASYFATLLYSLSTRKTFAPRCETCKIEKQYSTDERERRRIVSWLYESSQPPLGISIKRRLIFISVANCAWQEGEGGGVWARVEFKINDYKLSRSRPVRRLLYSLAHFTIDSLSGVSCRALGRGRKKKRRGKKKEKEEKTTNRYDSGRGKPFI